MTQSPEARQSRARSSKERVDDFGPLFDRVLAGDPDVDASAVAQRYSYVFPDAHALETLLELGPLVEMGAGTGYWGYRLRALGADIIAFDQAPPDQETPNRYHAKADTWIGVERGDASALAAYPNRALFLCWPPLFSSLGDSLVHYTGATVACIGDGGERTARLRLLDDTFVNAATHSVRALDPAPGRPATLSIWHRAIRPTIDR